MQPTIDAELAGARRVLEPLAADRSLPAEVTVQLKTVMGMLKRLETSWSRVLPYLLSDNARIAELLRDAAPSLPANLQTEIGSVVSVPSPAPDPRALDATAANELNERLRDLLTRALAAQPSGADGGAPALRTGAVASLRQSLEARPW